MTVIRWLGCDLVTGQIVEELPDLTTSGTISSLLGAYTSASMRLPIPIGGRGAAPLGWIGATEPGRSMIVAVLGDQPVWAGIVVRRQAGTDALAELACMSIEGYLDRRFVDNHEWVEQDEVSVIAAGILADADLEGIGLVVDAAATGTLRDRLYFNSDDKSIYSAMRELMGVDGGPEWTVRLAWADDEKRVVTKTVLVASRIGYVSSTPTEPQPTGNANAVFSSSGDASARYEYAEDWTASSGSNHVVATSTGSGYGRPESEPARAEDLLASGWPRWERRFTPSTSITDIDTLDAHATAALALMRNGARTMTITARADGYPRLGVDWGVGDDVGYDLIGHRHPTGVKGVARAVGWELDPAAGTVSPILLLPEEA
jgi:hypothetical protein